uniref:Ankyrin repeat and KH domain-containing protein 1-like n=1 Tax=Saccoglossus kowalevskii TaxID=10224 RepID=A0ABM0M8B1_SACKO
MAEGGLRDFCDDFYRAAANGDFETLQTWLDKGHDVDTEYDEERMNALTVAVRNNHFPAVELLLSRGANVNQTNVMTALMYAAENNSCDAITLLLKHGADIHHQDKFQNTALMYAARNNSCDAITLLLKHDADINHQNKNQKTALMYAAGNNSCDAITLLLKHGADIHHQDKDQKTALIYAAENNSCNTITLLLKHGADINHQDEYQKTALMYAASKNSCDAITLLLKHGADIHHQDRDQNTALMYAAENNSCDAITLLLKHGADIHHQDEDQKTALMYAAENSSCDAITILLKHGADINHQDKTADTSLLIACGANSYDAVKVLLSKSEINHRDKYQKTALMYAASKNSCDAITLLKHGADIHHQNMGQRTALMYAAENNSCDAITLLLKHGADIHHQDKYQMTALMYAAVNNSCDAITLLLKHGADIHHQNMGQMTALMYAAVNNSCDAITLLLKHGADIHHQDMYQKTALMYAASKNSCDVITLLLKHGADIHHQDMGQMTALMYAAENNSCDVITLLLKHGADIHHQDKNADTSLLIACEANRYNAVKLLLSKSEINHRNKQGGNALNKVLQRPWYTLDFDVDTKTSALNIMKLLLETHIDINNVDERMQTPLEYIDSNIREAGIKTDFYKEAKLLLLNAIQEREKSELMMQDGVKIDAVKFYFAGHGGVGKTTLKETLMRRNYSCPPGKDDYVKTAGIEVMNYDLPGVGRSSLWDFAGQAQLFVSHTLFLDPSKATFLLVYKIVTHDGKKLVRPMDLKETNLKELFVWLKMIRNSFIQSDIDPAARPEIILVASRADWANEYKNEAALVKEEILKECKEMIKDQVHISDETFLVNCNDGNSSEMQELRAVLRNRRDAILKLENPMPKICDRILKSKNDWTRDNIGFPVMSWSKYFDLIKNTVDSMVKEDFLRTATKYLHYGGHLIHLKGIVKDGTDVVVLVPQWMCSRVMGPFLASEEFIQFAKKLPKRMTHERQDIESVFDEATNKDLVVELLGALELLFLFKKDSEDNFLKDLFIIPTLLPDRMPD